MTVRQPWLTLIPLQGKMADGAEVAVKRLAAHSGQGLEEFKNEIQLIAKLSLVVPGGNGV